MRTLLAALLLSTVTPLLTAPATAQQVPTEATRGWAIMSGGRVKPLDTFARETVLAITGKASIDGLSALDVVWGYHLAAASFGTRAHVRVDSNALKVLLGLDATERRFAFELLRNNSDLHQLVERASGRDDAELGQIERDALDVYARLRRVAGLVDGTALQLVPVPRPDGSWSSPTELEHTHDPASQAIHTGFAALAQAYAAADAPGFEAAAAQIGSALRTLGGATYPSDTALARELRYNDWNLFGKAWVLYLLGFLLIAIAGFGPRRGVYAVGLALLILGFVGHSTGLGQRWLIAGRAPVSDMYESLVFMSWGVTAIGLGLEALYRRRYFALVAGLMGFLTLMFAERLPLDSSINPLVPVLAHTSWLSIHVMTIMLSYSAFALTMALGHVVIAVQLFRPGKTGQLRTLSSLLYKALQVGLLFLAAGIVFGAIWANESWGRYWGWDPKETWSLITFFVYLAVVHARFAGWLHNFGLAVSAIVGFLSVLMTYYGVNFVLGAGLHSYGFASGGLFWAVLFCAVEVAVIGAAAVRYRSAIRAGLISRSALA